jgi:hypothetical protein
MLSVELFGVPGKTEGYDCHNLDGVYSPRLSLLEELEMRDELDESIVCKTTVVQPT